MPSHVKGHDLVVEEPLDPSRMLEAFKIVSAALADLNHEGKIRILTSVTVMCGLESQVGGRLRRDY
jgi:hypothetical protein